MRPKRSTPQGLVIAMFVVLTGTAGMLTGIATAAGDLGLAFVVVTAAVALIFWASAAMPRPLWITRARLPADLSA